MAEEAHSPTQTRAPFLPLTVIVECLHPERLEHHPPLHILDHQHLVPHRVERFLAYGRLEDVDPLAGICVARAAEREADERVGETVGVGRLQVVRVAEVQVELAGLRGWREDRQPENKTENKTRTGVEVHLARLRREGGEEWSKKEGDEEWSRKGVDEV
jgi:hypothetical protein